MHPTSLNLTPRAEPQITSTYWNTRTKSSTMEQSWLSRRSSNMYYHPHLKSRQQQSFWIAEQLFHSESHSRRWVTLNLNLLSPQTTQQQLVSFKRLWSPRRPSQITWDSTGQNEEKLKANLTTRGDEDDSTGLTITVRNIQPVYALTNWVITWQTCPGYEIVSCLQGCARLFVYYNNLDPHGTCDHVETASNKPLERANQITLTII